ncbi:hypothetical protein Esi_0346_0039 [Ectocarpus siliculosus]|uniref:Uncharacterized protein n=1 Tax=Ectocarpus siliculosus TaxID=2880 RepID=D7FYL1_ECTSI|nr:hypothetical protein Esi_0346_0039 [Ectocarpus siliculosus]|eukprot:CBJ32553.1 hypothetical protein Esi_0346_0039 [Ectocarpus siliculosus]
MKPVGRGESSGERVKRKEPGIEELGGPAMRSHISTEAMERSLWGSFTHQQIFMKDFIAGRYREAKQKKQTRKKSNPAVCLYVFRGGVVTLCLHPNDLQQAWRWGLDKEELLVPVTKDEFFKSFQRGDWRHSLVTLPATSSERAHLVAVIRQKSKVEIAIVNKRTLRDVEYFNSLHDIRRQAIARHEGSDDSSSSDFSLTRAGRTIAEGTVGGRGPTANNGAPATSSPRRRPFRRVATMAARPEARAGAGATGAGTDTSAQQQPSSRSNWSTVGSSHGGALVARGSSRNNRRVGSVASGSGGDSDGFHATMHTTRRRERWACQPPTTAATSRTSVTSTTASGVRRSALVTRDSSSKSAGKESPGGGFAGRRDGNVPTARVTKVSFEVAGGGDGRGHRSGAVLQSAASLARMSRFLPPKINTNRSDRSGKHPATAGTAQFHSISRSGTRNICGGATAAPRMVSSSAASSSAPTIGNGAESCKMAPQSVYNIARPTSPSAAWKMGGGGSVANDSDSGIQDTPSTSTAGVSTLVSGAALDRVRTTDCVGDSGIQDTPSTSTAGASALLSVATLDRARTTGCVVVVANGPKDDTIVGEGGDGSDTDRFGVTSVGTPLPSTLVIAEGSDGTCNGLTLADRSLVFGTLSESEEEPEEEETKEEGYLREEKYNEPQAGLTDRRPQETECGKGAAPSNPGEVISIAATEASPSTPPSPSVSPVPNGSVVGSATGRATEHSESSTSSASPQPEQAPVLADTAENMGATDFHEKEPAEAPVAMAEQKDEVGLQETDKPGATRYPPLSPPPSSQLPNKVVTTGVVRKNDATGVQDTEEPAGPSRSPPTTTLASSSPPPLSSPSGQAISLPEDAIGGVAMGVVRKNDATGVQHKEEPAGPSRSPSTPPLASSCPSSLSSPPGQSISLSEVAAWGETAVSEEEVHLLDIELAVRRKDRALQEAQCQIELLLREKGAASDEAARDTKLQLREKDEALKIAEEMLRRSAERQRELNTQLAKSLHEVSLRETELETALRKRGEEDKRGNEENKKIQAAMRQVEEEAALAHTKFESLREHATREVLAAQQKATEEVGRAQLRYESLCERTMRESAAAEERANREAEAVQEKAREEARGADDRYNALHAHTVDKLAEREQAERQLSELNENMEREVLRLTKELGSCSKSRNYALVMLGKQSELKAEAVKEAEDLRRKLAAAEFESAADLAETRLTAHNKEQSLQQELLRSCQQTAEVKQIAEDAVASVQQGEMKYAEYQAAAGARVAAAEVRVTDLNERLADMHEQETTAAGAASEHALMLQERIEALGEDLEDIADHAAAADDRSAAAEARVTDLNERIAVLQRQATVAGGEASERATMLQERIGLLGEDLSGVTDRAAAAHARSTAAEARVTDLNERIAVLQRQATVAAGAASEHTSMLQERVGLLGEDLAGMTDRAAAADVRSTTAEARVTDVNERIAVLQRQTAVMAGAASQHATMLQDRIEALREGLAGTTDRAAAADVRSTTAEARVADLNERIAILQQQATVAAGEGGMTDRAAAADVRSTAAEARVTDLNERIAVLQRQATKSAGEAGEHASMLQDRMELLGQDLAGMTDRAAAAEARSTAAEERVADLNERLHALQRRATAVTAAGEASEHATMLQEGAEALSQDLRGMTDATVAESRAASLATSAGFSAAGAETTNEVMDDNDDELISRALERVASVDLSIARYAEASAELRRVADWAPEVTTNETPRSRARSQGIEVAAVGRVAGAEVRTVELGIGNARLCALAVTGNEESKEEGVGEEVRARRLHLSAENSHFEHEVADGYASPHERARWEDDARLEGTVEGEAERESANGCHWRAAMADLREIDVRMERLQPIIEAGGEWLRLQRSKDEEGWGYESAASSRASEALARRVSRLEDWRDGLEEWRNAANEQRRAETDALLRFSDEARTTAGVFAGQRRPGALAEERASRTRRQGGAHRATESRPRGVEVPATPAAALSDGGANTRR